MLCISTWKRCYCICLWINMITCKKLWGSFRQEKGLKSCGEALDRKKGCHEERTKITLVQNDPFLSHNWRPDPENNKNSIYCKISQLLPLLFDFRNFRKFSIFWRTPFFLSFFLSLLANFLSFISLFWSYDLFFLHFLYRKAFYFFLFTSMKRSTTICLQHWLYHI